MVPRRSLGGRYGRHRRIRLAHPNSMTGEFSPARGASGTVMRHFVHVRAFAAPALGVTVPAATRLLAPASRRTQRFTPSGAAATYFAMALASVRCDDSGDARQSHSVADLASRTCGSRAGVFVRPADSPCPARPLLSRVRSEWTWSARSTISGSSSVIGGRRRMGT